MELTTRQAPIATTIGMAVDESGDVTAEAANVMAMDNSLKKVDEFMHISRRRKRSIALQSAIGGMLLSPGGMMLQPRAIWFRWRERSPRKSSTSCGVERAAHRVPAKSHLGYG
jgi:hypothetical protein